MPNGGTNEAETIAWLLRFWPDVPAFTRAWKRKRTSEAGPSVASANWTVVPAKLPSSASAASVKGVKGAPFTEIWSVPAT